MQFIQNVDYKKIHIPNILKGRVLKYELLKPAETQTKLRPKKAIKYKGGILHPNGKLVLPTGWRWDGATGALDTDDILRASCFHDWFCDAIDDEIISPDYRKPADKLFYQINREDGMSWLRALYTYRAVRNWGRIKHIKD